MKEKNNLHSNKRGSNLEPLLNSVHKVTVEKLIVGGQGLARINYEGQALVVFVPLSAPQDELSIKIVATEKNHLLAEVVEIIRPSPFRKSAPCSYFGSCGGCTWQHVTYDEQIRQKELILTDLFKKFIPDVPYQLEKTIFSEKTLNYRNRIQLKQFNSELGYFKRGAHEIVNIDSCLIAEEIISSKISELKTQLRPAKELKKFELHLNLEGDFEYYPIGEAGERLSFSQVNNLINESLIKHVQKLVEKSTPKTLTELYAGAGNFTFPLLESLSGLKIESAELNSKLTAHAVKKMLANNLQKRLQIFTTDCESFVQRRQISSDFLLLDPPRAGCSDQVIEKILQNAPQNILYISCHPAYLARDLKKIFLKYPSYKISYLQIFDMFPQTDHFETLIFLTK